MQDKKIKLRQEMKSKLAAMADNWRKQKSQLLIQSVVTSSFWEKAQVVALFAGRSDEVDTTFFWKDDAARRKRVCYPKVSEDGLIFLEVEKLAALQKGRWDLQEPVGDRILKPDLIIVPGLAFAPNGGRLGRGQGFYDRYLATDPVPTTLGICFDFQIVADLPTEAHDTVMDGIATEKKIYLRTI